jgi:hypothetical protein
VVAILERFSMGRPSLLAKGKEAVDIMSHCADTLSD